MVRVVPLTGLPEAPRDLLVDRSGETLFVPQRGVYVLHLDVPRRPQGRLP